MIMAWRDRDGLLNFVFHDESRVLDNKERDVKQRWEWCGGYERIWEIRSITYLIGLGKPHLSVITPRIETRTWHIEENKFIRLPNSLNSQSRTVICATPLISLLLVLNSSNTEEHEVRLSFSIPPCHDYESTLSTGYTAYCIMPTLTVSCSQPVPRLSALSRPCCTQFSTFPQLLWGTQWIGSQVTSHLPPKWLPPHWPPPGTPRISLDHDF